MGRDIRKPETLEGMNEEFKNDFIEEFVSILQSAIAFWFIGIDWEGIKLEMEKPHLCDIGKINVLKRNMLEWAFALENICVDEINKFLDSSEEFFEIIKKCKKKKEE